MPDLQRETAPSSAAGVAARFVLPCCGALAVVYGFLALCHPVGSWWLGALYSPRSAAVLAAGTSLLYGLTFAWLRRREFRDELAHPLLFAFGVGMVANSVAFHWLVPEPIHTTNAILIALAAGMLVLSRGWLAAVLALDVAGWLAVALAAPPDPTWFHWGATLGLCCLLSATVHEVRLRGVLRLIELQGVAEERRAEASRALATAQEQLARREEIERELQERDRRLAESQRRESLGLMAGGIAHDFNNLLTPILGHAELGQLQVEEPSAREAFGEILAAGRHAAQLSRQMLAYAGRAPIQITSSSLADLVSEPMRLLRASLPKSTRLEIHTDAETTAAEADPTAIGQVLVNLVRNASDALGGERGTVRVRLGAASLDAECLRRLDFPPGAVPGRFATITVEDDGSGMAPDVQARMFDPFFSTKAAGSGLGLAAALGIANAHGGAFEVESRVGRGTRVRLYLAAKEATAARTPPPRIARNGEHPLRVLVVDDEPAVRRVAQEMLEKAGHTTRTAGGVREALALEAEALGSTDVVLIDLSMPDGDGLALATILADRDERLGIVLMSGFDPSAARDGSDSTRFPFLAKPFRSEELLLALQDQARR